MFQFYPLTKSQKSRETTLQQKQLQLIFPLTMPISGFALRAFYQWRPKNRQKQPSKRLEESVREGVYKDAKQGGSSKNNVARGRDQNKDFRTSSLQGDWSF